MPSLTAKQSAGKWRSGWGPRRLHVKRWLRETGPGTSPGVAATDWTPMLMALPRRRAARGNGVMPSRLSDLRHVRLFFLPGALGRFAQEHYCLVGSLRPGTYQVVRSLGRVFCPSGKILSPSPASMLLTSRRRDAMWSYSFDNGRPCGERWRGMRRTGPRAVKDDESSLASISATNTPSPDACRRSMMDLWEV
jgi:hypothetical protein